MGGEVSSLFPQVATTLRLPMPLPRFLAPLVLIPEMIPFRLLVSKRAQSPTPSLCFPVPFLHAPRVPLSLQVVTSLAPPSAFPPGIETLGFSARGGSVFDLSRSPQRFFSLCSQLPPSLPGAEIIRPARNAKLFSSLVNCLSLSFRLLHPEPKFFFLFASHVGGIMLSCRDRCFSPFLPALKVIAP